MKLETEVSSLIINLATCGLMLFAMDRAYRLARLWLQLRRGLDEEEILLSRHEVLGPRPIRLTTLHAASAEAPTIQQQGDSTG